MIDTSGTRYRVEDWAPDTWVFNGWQNFLRSVGLTDFDHFLALSGEQMGGRDRKSVVFRLELGDPIRVFYVKSHKNYVTKSLKTWFRTIPQVRMELDNLMCYARAGLDVLEPVAWGWRPDENGGDSFLLIEELYGYKSLKEWLEESGSADRTQRRLLAKAVNRMLLKIHQNGLAHVDLFSWHVFVKKEGDEFIAHPIDLERTKKRGVWPRSDWYLRRKQAHDLAVLHLTVPWPLVNYSERMRFFLDYRQHRRLTREDKKLLQFVLTIARKRGGHGKFWEYGIANKLNPNLL